MKAIKNIMITLSGIALLASCDMDKFFELDRPESNPWLSVDDLEYSVADPYNTLFQNPNWQAPIGIIPYYQELVADLSTVNPQGAYEQEALYWYPRQMSTFDVTGQQFEKTFSILYRSVTGATSPLTYIEEKEKKGEPVFANMTENDKKTLARQTGELYFMRGYTYWLISRAFVAPYDPAGGEGNNRKFIPLINRLDYSQESARNPYMGTVKEVYDQMLSDFAKAKSLMPEDYFVRGRANKFAADMMLMRVKWLMGDKDGALEEADYVITKAEAGVAPFDLTEEPIVAFNRNAEQQYTVDPVSKEVMFECAFTESNQGNNVAIPLARMCKTGIYNFKSKTFDASNKLWLEGARGSQNWQHGGWACAYWNPRLIKYIGWAVTDDPMDLTNYVPSAEALADKRFTQLHYFLKNYTDGGDKTIHEMAYNKTKWNAFWNDKYYRAPYGKYSQVPLIRLAEAYLTRATLVLSKNVSQALGDVNKIRQRAGLTPLKNVTEADIEKERIKEFGFENGDRLLYLVAMQKTIDGQKRNPGAVYDNPNTDGDPIPAMNPPYSTMYVPLPSIEYLYSGSYPQP